MKLKLFVFVIGCFLACRPPQGQADPGEAKFIFRGITEKIGEATLKEVSDASNCIIVKVTEVISAPPGFSDWTNRSVTVAVKGIERQKPGQEKVFYTNGWLYGEGLAVVEVSSVDGKEISNKQVIDRVNSAQDKKVTERLRSSELIVAGQITRIDTMFNNKKQSEHDPDWATAVIRTDTLLKGNAGTSEIKFRFPVSDDVMWADAPKFSNGQKGIWLLRRKTNALSDRNTKAPTDTNRNMDVYTIIEKSDYFPLERLAYIRALLR
jgi:hypothetical protein